MSFNATSLPHEASPSPQQEQQRKQEKPVERWTQSASASSRHTIGQHTCQSQQQEAVTLHSGDVGTHLASEATPPQWKRLSLRPSLTLSLQPAGLLMSGDSSHIAWMQHKSVKHEDQSNDYILN